MVSCPTRPHLYPHLRLLSLSSLHPKRPLYYTAVSSLFPTFRPILGLAFLWTGRLLGLKAGCFLSFRSQLKGHVSRGTHHDRPLLKCPPGHSLPNYFISYIAISLFNIILFINIFVIFMWNKQGHSLSCSLLYPYDMLGRRRQRHPTPVLLPGKSHGWRSLVGCSPWGHKEPDTDKTERLHFHFHTLEKEVAAHPAAQEAQELRFSKHVIQGMHVLLSLNPFWLFAALLIIAC